jgi:acetyl-CoA carboxylase biotin carboxyl carrier protein
MAKQTIELETGGTVWKVLAKAGDMVAEGQELFILEVMKMEVPYTAPASGRLCVIHIAEGDVVEEGQAAAEIETG